MATADNDRFIRLWHEVNYGNIGLGFSTRQAAKASQLKWFPFTKGGSYRNWYGNNEYVVNWQNDGEEIRNFSDSATGRIRSHNYNLEYIFQHGITWGTIASGKPSFRFCNQGYLYSNSGYGMFFENPSYLKTTLALLNSPVAQSVINMLSPGIGIESGYIRKIPFIRSNENFDNIVNSNISISKADWDAHETSWDFEKSPLLSIDEDTYFKNIDWEIEKHRRLTGEEICIDPSAPQFNSLEWCLEQYCQKWESLFYKLHDNEEDLNRKFIDIYGLQDELSPDVPLKEVTILQQGEISIEKENTITDDGSHVLMIDGIDPIIVNVPEEKIVWHRDVIIKQLISYIVGCFMGRYRLDKPGLAIAHPNPSEEELAEYPFSISQNETFTIDSDAIIPLLPLNAPFYDNLYNYVSEFVKKVWSEEDHNENMNYIERCLGKPLNDYLLKDFWKDHKKMYQNRPIYWLFSSKKGAFRALVYAHRMHAYTVEQVRSRYLLKYMDWLRSEISKLEQREADLSTQERRSLDRLRFDLAECDEYHERLQVVAEQAITFDLDDGIPHNHALFGDILMKLK